MSNFTVEVTGEEMIRDNIAKIAQQMEPDVVEGILLTQSDMVKERIVTNAPQGPTGNLKRGIVSKILVRKSENKYAPAFVGINYGIAPHAHLVEKGHILWRGGKRARGEGYQIGVVEAHEFFFPAWHSSQDEVRENIEQAIKESIEGAPSA